jgi:hypothetical protein
MTITIIKRTNKYKGNKGQSNNGKLNEYLLGKYNTVSKKMIKVSIHR